MGARLAGGAGGILVALPAAPFPPPHHATAWSPFLATRVRSFREAPCGCFSPRSHWLTSPVVTFRYRAKTAWLAPSRKRRPRISVGFSGRTGVRHSSSNSRIVRLSITPAAWRPSAVSWIDAITGLRYCFLIAYHLRQRSRCNHPSDGFVIIVPSPELPDNCSASSVA